MKRTNSIILGVELASKAITFSFRHAKLFIYPAIGFLIALFFNQLILFFNVLQTATQEDRMNLLKVVYMIIIPFVSVSIIKHARDNILNTQTKSVIYYLRFSFHEIVYIFLYLILYLFLSFTMQILQISQMPWLEIALQLFIDGLLFFVLVLIAIDKKDSAIRYIRESITLFFAHWLTIVGGAAWIRIALAFIIFILLLPFILLSMTSIQLLNQNLHINLTPILLFFIETLINSFKAMLYLRIIGQLPAALEPKATQFF